MADRFAKFVADAEEALPRLPLFHNCDGLSFRDILSVDQLKPSKCSVFNEELLYFFYGRPAYRAVKDGNAVSNNSLYPICIVVSPNAPLNPVRIAPFDTGAFAKGLYSGFMNPRMTRADFFAEPSTDSPPRIVRTFFGNNDNYFHGKPVSLRIPPLEFEARSYYDLILSSITSPEDDRRQTVEVQVKDPLNLAEANVLLVILPAEFLQEEEVRAGIKRWSAKVRTYPTFRWNPGEYTFAFFYHVEKYLRNRGFINER